MNEQYQRFYELIDTLNLHCDVCPLQEKCAKEQETLSIEEAENQPTCEETLLHYILTGEFLPLK